MSQPPYPPPGDSEPQGEQPESWAAWPPPPENADQPTEQLGTPGGQQREQTQQFGPPLYGQQPGAAPSGPPQYGQYGQPQYGAPQYGQPQYGQPQYGQPQYGQQYGQPQYGQQYGQPGQPPYGQPGVPWGPPGGPGGQRPKGSRNTLIALVVAGVVVLAAIGVALFLVLAKGDTSTAGATATGSGASSGSSERTPSSSASASSSADSSTPGGASGIPPAGASPDGLGDDPVLDQYAQSCHDGDMNACDTLYNDSDVGSAYETYGGTCGGRQPASNSDVVYCTDAFPG